MLTARAPAPLLVAGVADSELISRHCCISKKHIFFSRF